ncbi:MAG: flippase [Ardenticatenaceae bacterium]|nr:flippase [Ardenticatenaceae bacterium]
MQVRSYAFPARRALAFVMPNFFGSPAMQSYTDAFTGKTVALPGTSEWGIKNYVEGGAYLGILPLFLVLLSLFSVISNQWSVASGQLPATSNQQPTTNDRRAQTGFFAAMSVLSLAFIFGTPLYALIYYGLPFADQIRTPFRWVFPLSLFTAVLAGFGMDVLQRLEIRDWRLRRQPPISNLQSLISLLAGLAFWGGLLLIAGLFASRAAYASVEPLVERLFHGLALADLAFPDARAFYSFEFRQLFILGLMLVATGTVLRVSRCPIYVRGIPIWLFMAAAALMLDLFVANVGFNTAVDPALLDYKPDLVQWLEQQPGEWRITSFAPHGDKPFNANSGWLYDLQDIRGYDSIIPRQFVDYMSAIEPQNELQYNRIQPIVNWESLNSPLLDVLNVKYIITSETIDLPKLQLAWQGDGLRVYENLAVAPRAYTLPQSSTVLADDVLAALTQFDPRNYVVVEIGDWKLPVSNLQSPISNLYSPATIDHYDNREVLVSAEVAEPAWLILNDSYFAGWKAYVRPYNTTESDEIEVPITRVNGNFRGVMLDAGHWTVRFRYSPASFQLGGLLSAMGVIVLLFGLVVWGWQAIVKPDAAMTTTRSIAKNSAAPMALNLFNKGIEFVFAMYYLRVLGPADAGSFATAIAAAGIFDILANFGLDILVIREVSKAREQASSYLLNTTILRLGAAVFASLPMLALVAGTNLFSNPFTRPEIVAIGFIMIGMVISGMSKGVTGLFYVYEKAETPAAVTTVTTMMKVGFGVAALLLGMGFVGLAAVSILTNLITLGILGMSAWRNFALPGPWQVDWPLQRRMVRLGFPLMLIHLLQTVFISVDVYLLRTMLPNGEEVVGWYSSAYKWFNALQIVPSYFTLALFPIISREIERSVEAARRMYQMSLKIMLLLALPIAAITTFLAYPLVAVLGGSEFLPHGAIALQIVIWSIPIGWLNSVTNYVLIALGLERMQPRAFAIAVGFNIIANALFIRAYSYVAASVTTILSEVVLLLVFEYYLRKRMRGLDWGRLAVRPLLVTVIMVGLMWLGYQVVGVGTAVIGIIAYPIGLWLFRVIGDDEKQILRATLPTAVTRRLRFLS